MLNRISGVGRVNIKRSCQVLYYIGLGISVHNDHMIDGLVRAILRQLSYGLERPGASLLMYQ